MRLKASVFALFTMLVVGCAGRTTIIRAPGPVLAPSARPLGFWENKEAVVQVYHNYQEWLFDFSIGNYTWKDSGGLTSGVAIRADGLVLTNNHTVNAGFGRRTKPIIRNEEILVCKVPNGILDCKPAKLLATDQKQDVAFLQTDMKFSHVAEIGDDTTLAAGDEVYMWGSAMRLAPIVPLFGRYMGRVSEPYVNQKETPLGLPMLLMDLSTVSAFSAGPIFNMSGKLVSLGSRHTSEKKGRPLSLSVPATTILKLLKDNNLLLN